MIYAVGGCGGTCTLSYPDGKQVGQIAEAGNAVCSDAQGNVFITHESTVDQYAHGGTTPTATLSLPGNQGWGCAVDPTTNNLAVVFNGNGSVAVFPNEGGSPTVYFSGLSGSYFGYDNAGNLFVSGYNVQAHAISELPQGQTTFTILSVNGTLGTRGQVQWDGWYITYEGRGSVPEVNIARLSISGSVATVVGTTSFKGTLRFAAQTWIYNGTVIVRYGKKATKINKIGIWKFPAGGKAETKFKPANTHDFSGVTVSVAPSR